MTIVTGAGGCAGRLAPLRNRGPGPGYGAGHAASVVVTVRVWSPKLAMRSSLPATVLVPGGGCGPASEQGARGVGEAGAPAGTRPAHRAGRAVDVRPAAGRAQPGQDHPGRERCRDSLSFGHRPEAQPAP